MKLRKVAAIALLGIVLVSTIACSSSSHQEPTLTPTSEPSISDTQFISLNRGIQRDDGEWVSNTGYISGEIQNIGNVYISGVTITVDWYSSSPGNAHNPSLRYQRSDSQTIYSLSPNEIQEFDIYFNGTGVSSRCGGSYTGCPIDKVYISNIW